MDFKLVEAESLLQIHRCFFHTVWNNFETTCLTIISSSHCLAASSAIDVWCQQSHEEKRTNYRNL